MVEPERDVLGQSPGKGGKLWRRFDLEGLYFVFAHDQFARYQQSSNEPRRYQA